MSEEDKQKQEKIICKQPLNDEQRHINNEGDFSYKEDEGRSPRPAEAPLDSEKHPADD